MWLFSFIPSVPAMCLIHKNLDPLKDDGGMITWVTSNESTLYAILLVNLPIYIFAYIYLDGVCINAKHPCFCCRKKGP